MMGFPGDSVVIHLPMQNPPANAGYASLIPRSGRSPGEGNGNPILYSCLESLMDRGTIGSQRVGHDLATKPPPHIGMID